MAGESIEAILIVSYLRDDMSKAGQAELDKWLNESADNRRSFEHVIHVDRVLAGLRSMTGVRYTVIGSKIADGLGVQSGLKPRKGFFRRMLPYAAAVISALVIGGGYYQYVYRQPASVTEVIARKAGPDGPRGSKYPLLIKPDGGVVRLNVTANGGPIGGVFDFRKLNDIEVKLEGVLGFKGKYYELIIPAGITYCARLADGSRVLLDAMSSLRIPADLSAGNRSVVLTGHGYFEINADQQHPFRIRSPHQEVEVLGTDLDILDHSEESMHRTALIDGKARVLYDKDSVLLRLGEVASVSGDQFSLRVLDHEQMERVTAWKRGYFNFDDMDIRSAAFRLGQWYGKEVIFSNDLATNSLGRGNFQRNLPLPVLLKDLESKHLHFDIKGDTIVVRK